MMNKIFSAKYVKVLKNEWDVIETKLSGLINLNASLSEDNKNLKSESNKIKDELETLRRYKERDEFLFNLEQENEILRKENKNLRISIEESMEKMDKINKNYEISKSTQSLFLSEISKLKGDKCMDYETKTLRNLYA